MNYDFKAAEKALEKEFERVNDIRDFNQKKVLKNAKKCEKNIDIRK